MPCRERGAPRLSSLAASLVARQPQPPACLSAALIYRGVLRPCTRNHVVRNSSSTTELMPPTPSGYPRGRSEGALPSTLCAVLSGRQAATVTAPRQSRHPRVGLREPRRQAQTPLRSEGCGGFGRWSTPGSSEPGPGPGAAGAGRASARSRTVGHLPL